MSDKAIRAAKLTAAGMLDKARAKTAVTRAGGQIAPSKYLPNVPRQVHADGGKVAFMQGNHPLVPEVLYHGTARDIRSFDPDAKRSYDVDPSNPAETDTGWFGKGHYFTASPKLAAHYANEGAKRQGQGEGANVLPAHVAMKNPFVVDMKAYDSGATTLDKALTGAGVPAPARGGWRKPSEQTAALIAMGHDGVIATREGKPEEYVAFHPGQIKSAISATTFDPASPDITKAGGGSVNSARAAFLAGNHPEVPDVVYHSTKGDFHEFHPLSHFGTKQAAHDRYSPDLNLSSGVSVIPAHISMKKPLDMGTERGWMDNSEMLHDVADRLERSHGEVANKIREHADWLMDNDQRHGSPEGLRHQGAAADLIKSTGYDGLIYTNTEEDPGSRSFVPMGPGQVKSTIGNQGTFDPNSPNMTKAEGGPVENDKPVDLSLVRSMRNFNQNSAGPTPEAEGVFNRLAAGRDAAADAHEAAISDGAFNNVQIGDVFKYKLHDGYTPMKVVDHGMVHVSRWGGINPPKYVYKDHYPVAEMKFTDGSTERRKYPVELLEDRDRYDFISGKPRAVRKRGGLVDVAMSKTRRFTKNGKAATMALKPKGK
jgi:hypothetical protein